MAFEYRISLCIPDPHILDKARELLDSDDKDLKEVARVILDCTAVSEKTRDAIMQNVQYDYTPYFDYPFGSALEAAQRIVETTTDEKTKSVASNLLVQADYAQASRNAVLRELKKLKKSRRFSDN